MLLWIITIVLHGALGAPKRLGWNLLEWEETTSCLSSCLPQLPVQAGCSAAKRTSGESSLYSVVIWWLARWNLRGGPRCWTESRWKGSTVYRKPFYNPAIDLVGHTRAWPSVSPHVTGGLGLTGVWNWEKIPRGVFLPLYCPSVDVGSGGSGFLGHSDTPGEPAKSFLEPLLRVCPCPGNGSIFLWMLAHTFMISKSVLSAMKHLSDQSFFFKISNPSTEIPDGSAGKPAAYPCRRRWRDPRVRKIPWRREWQPTPVFFPGESHGQRSLAGCSPRGCQDLDTA